MPPGERWRSPTATECSKGRPFASARVGPEATMPRQAVEEVEGPGPGAGDPSRLRSGGGGARPLLDLDDPERTPASPSQESGAELAAAREFAEFI